MANTAYGLDDSDHGVPCLTDWLVASGALDSPLVVVDGGVNGGLHPRWRALGDYLHGIGFDPVASVIETLRAGDGMPGRTEYHQIALDDHDGESRFIVRANDTASSFYGEALSEEGGVAVTVSVRCLDSLIAEGLVPPLDFLKLDCEGHEPTILKGSGNMARAAHFFALQSELSFRVSDVLPDTHFGAVYAFAVRNNLELFSLIYDRHLREPYAAFLRDQGFDKDFLARHGQVATADALFMSDVARQLQRTAEYRQVDAAGFAAPLDFQPPSADKLLKLAIIFELYGLRDCALDLIEVFADPIGGVIDVERARHCLLVAPGAGAKGQQP